LSERERNRERGEREKERVLRHFHDEYFTGTGLLNNK